MIRTILLYTWLSPFLLLAGITLLYVAFLFVIVPWVMAVEILMGLL